MTKSCKWALILASLALVASLLLRLPAFNAHERGLVLVGQAPADCGPPINVVYTGAPRVPGFPRGKGRAAGPVRDPWECWYSDVLKDWMCPVPAGSPWGP